MAGVPLELVLTRLAGGPQLRAEELSAVTPAEWTVLDARAGEHRLRPLLHHRWRTHRAVPADLLARWAEAHRASALEALAQRRALIALVERLAGAGIAALALKGAWLAWHAYPEPALRPLRDLDLLLAPEDALRARALLLADGWREVEPGALSPEDWLARFKHLPELVSPEGIWLDLHARLWDEAPSRPAMPEGLVARAVPDPAAPQLRYPAPADMLMHLAMHASVHRFDGGPLMLADIDRLLARETFDWPAVFARARDEGWARPLALLLAATRQWGCQGLWRGPEELPPVPDALIADIPFLLAKPLAARASDIAAAKRGAAQVSLPEKMRRVWRRRERYAGAGAYFGWLAGEARTALAAHGDTTLADRRTRIARLDAWLAG